jgi:hypothetical protein
MAVVERGVGVLEDDLDPPPNLDREVVDDQRRSIGPADEPAALA